jgi:hypothetical protein
MSAVEWGRRADFHEAAEALEVTTADVLAVVTLPGRTERLCLFTMPGAPTLVYRARLARDGYGILRQSTEAVALPGLWEQIQEGLDDIVG